MMDGEGEKTTPARERIAKIGKIFFMFGRWISFPFRGSIMDIFNAAQHALPLGPPALESFFFILFRISRARPPSNLLLLINQEERKNGKCDVAVVKKIVIWFSFFQFRPFSGMVRAKAGNEKLDDS